MLSIRGSLDKYSPSNGWFVTLDLKVELANDKSQQDTRFKTFESSFSHLYTMDTDNAFLDSLIRSILCFLLYFGMQTF